MKFVMELWPDLDNPTPEALVTYARGLIQDNPGLVWDILDDEGDPLWENIYPHQDYPHEPGRLHGCQACEARCHCDPDPGTTACVYDGTDDPHGKHRREVL